MDKVKEKLRSRSSVIMKWNVMEDLHKGVTKSNKNGPNIKKMFIIPKFIYIVSITLMGFFSGI